MFNKNNVKISYSCIANIKSIINMHNKEVLTEKKTQAVNLIATFPTNVKLRT